MVQWLFSYEKFCQDQRSLTSCHTDPARVPRVGSKVSRGYPGKILSVLYAFGTYPKRIHQKIINPGEIIPHPGGNSKHSLHTSVPPPQWIFILKPQCNSKIRSTSLAHWIWNAMNKTWTLFSGINPDQYFAPWLHPGGNLDLRRGNETRCS